MASEATLINPSLYSLVLCFQAGHRRRSPAQLIFCDRVGVRELACLGGAGLNARRLFALREPIPAQAALGHNSTVGPPDRAEGTDQHTTRTAYAKLPLEQYGLVAAQAVERRRRANRGARGILALLALKGHGPTSNLEYPHPCSRPGALQNCSQQGLGFRPADGTSQFATVTAYALFQIRHNDLHLSLFPLTLVNYHPRSRPTLSPLRQKALPPAAHSTPMRWVGQATFC